VFNKAPLKQDKNVPTSGKPRYVFELWRLVKVDNKLEHNMVEQDDKTWYWCDKHKYNGINGVVSNGMYVTHKLDQHDSWVERRTKGNRRASNIASTNSKLKATPPASNDSSASKLSLSKSLQVALVTMAGISDDQFNKIWANACSALGN
jgi:hypothetical protein